MKAYGISLEKAANEAAQLINPQMAWAREASRGKI